MHLRLYKFSKRSNSTAIPTNNDNLDPVIKDAQINDGMSSILNFRITVADKIKRDEAGNIIIITDSQTKETHYAREYKYYDYNYAYITEFKRYYYIDDWRYEGQGKWSASCNVDPLASWRASILASPAFVTRHSNPDVELSNPTMIDSFYPTCKGYKLVDTAVGNALFTFRPENSVYVIGVIENANPQFGAVNYYMINRTQLNILVSNMVSPYMTAPNTDWQDTSLTSEMLKTLVSPMQYIVSCKWLPIDCNIAPIPGNFTNHSTSIYLGAWDTGAVGVKLGLPYTTYSDSFDGVTISKTQTITKPVINQQTVGFDDFIEGPPYVSYSLFNSMLGTFEIDPAIACTAPELKMTSTINLVSGVYTILVSAPETPSNITDGTKYFPILHSDINIGIDIPLADVSNQYVNMAKTAVGMVGDAWSVNTLLNPGGAIANAICDGIDLLQYTFNQSVVSTGSANGNVNPSIIEFYYIAKVSRTYPQYRDLWGVPYNKRVSRIGDIAAYDYRLQGYFVQASWLHLVRYSVMWFPGSGSTPSRYEADMEGPTMLAPEVEAITEAFKKGVYMS